MASAYTDGSSTDALPREAGNLREDYTSLSMLLMHRTTTLPLYPTHEKSQHRVITALADHGTSATVDLADHSTWPRTKREKVRKLERDLMQSLPPGRFHRKASGAQERIRRRCAPPGLQWDPGCVPHTLSPTPRSPKSA